MDSILRYFVHDKIVSAWATYTQNSGVMHAMSNHRSYSWSMYYMEADYHYFLKDILQKNKHDLCVFCHKPDSQLHWVTIFSSIVLFLVSLPRSMPWWHLQQWFQSISHSVCLATWFFFSWVTSRASSVQFSSCDMPSAILKGKHIQHGSCSHVWSEVNSAGVSSSETLSKSSTFLTTVRRYLSLVKGLHTGKIGTKDTLSRPNLSYLVTTNKMGFLVLLHVYNYCSMNNWSSFCDLNAKIVLCLAFSYWLTNRQSFALCGLLS